MIPFFQKIPKIFYNDVLLTDISARVKYSEFDWVKDPLLYYDYVYQDIDTPDTIANKYYGDSTLHWIILLTNGIINPNFDLPMNSVTFNNYLNSKYKTQGNELNISGYKYALTTPDPVYGYQKTITVTNISTNTVLRKNYYNIDKRTYELTSEYTKFFVDNFQEISYDLQKNITTIYQKEMELNEEKRNIKLLKEEYKLDAVRSLNTLISNIQNV